MVGTAEDSKSPEEENVVGELDTFNEQLTSLNAVSGQGKHGNCFFSGLATKLWRLF